MKESLLTVIMLSFNSSGRIAKAYNKLSILFHNQDINFELVIIDDGSTDGSIEEAQSLEKTCPNVRSYQLSRNYTSNYAIFAGLSVCEGDCAVVIPDDEQQPYEVLVEMFTNWQQGHKLIIPFRENNEDNIFKKNIAGSFHNIMRCLTGLKFPSGGTDTFLVDRELIDIINTKIHPVRTAILPELLRLGFNPLFFPYTRKKSINLKSRWTLKKKIRLANDILYSSSSFPIKTMLWSGVLLITLSLFMAVAILGGYCSFLATHKAEFVLLTGMSFFTGLIIFALGVIGEYIIRIYDETKARPGFIIRKQETS